MAARFSHSPRKSHLKTIALAALLGGLSALPMSAQDVQPTRAADLPAAPVNDLVALSDSFTRLAEAMKSSVVYVEVISRQPQATRRGAMPFDPRMLPPELRERFEEEFGDRQDEQDEARPGPRRQGAGSGWVYDDQGHIVTNAHVVRGAERITIVFADNTRVSAKVVGEDPQTDVAVVKLDTVPDNLTPAKRSPEMVRQGEIVFAFGSPFRYRFSMSQGIVSGMGRQTGILGQDGYEDFIQTDAAINPGNSGGPLTDARGRVVGMNTAIFSRTGSFSGIGFAVPLNIIESVVPQLIDSGEVNRARIGAFISDDPRLLKSFGVLQGVVLQDVLPDSAAAKAGLKAGDVVTQIDGKNVSSANTLRSRIAAMQPGAEVSLTVIRNRDAMEVPVILEAADPEATTRLDGEPDAEEADLLKELGLAQTQTLPRQLAAERELEGPAVLVRAVTPSSSAAEAGLSAGTAITHVMDQRVETPEELAEAIQATKGDMIRLRVQSQDRRSGFVVLQRPE